MRRKLFAPLACLLLTSLLVTAPPSYTKAAAAAPAAAEARDAKDARDEAPASPGAAPFAPAPQAENVVTNGFFSVDPAQQGSSFQAAVVMEIPRGMHVNSNRPLGKYAVATTVKVESPRGLRVTPVSYPRGSVRSFNFGGAAPERLAVYEGRAIFRFNVTVAPNAELGVARVRVNLRFQSCTDEVCFPPANRELVLPIAIVNHDARINHINGRYFGGGRRR